MQNRQAGTTAHALFILRTGVIVRYAPDGKPQEHLDKSNGFGESPLMFGRVST
jgi:hypothetical protein